MTISAGRATRSFALRATALAVLSGCVGEAPDAASRREAISEITVPAAPGSGQPFLEAVDDGVWMSWTEPLPHGGHRVAVSFYDLRSGRWSPSATVAEGDGFFVNWADFPSVRVFGDRLFAHWLWRGGHGTYDYGVRVAWSDDRGRTWAQPVTPHEDGTPTEHGFVSFFRSRDFYRSGDGVWAVWLDGRAMVAPGGTMSLRARMLATRDATGWNSPGTAPPAVAPSGPETLVDAMVCECCQTAAAIADGVPVIAFRNRAEGEIRDIHVSRLLQSGWTPSTAVHNDGWVFGGCPVNGPAMSARGAEVAVAWFTASGNEPRVNIAFSDDGALTFGPPRRVDPERALGRVDLALLDDGSALVTWLEAGAGAQGAAIRSRRVARDGSVSDPATLAATDAARASGFPRIARLGTDRLMLAWTDPGGEGRVRASIVDLALWELPS